MIDASNLEELATALEANSDYRVLRRLRPRGMAEGFDGVETRTGLMVDVETAFQNTWRKGRTNRVHWG